MTDASLDNFVSIQTSLATSIEPFQVAFACSKDGKGSGPE